MLHQINYPANFEHYFIVILRCKHCQSTFKGGVWNDLFETDVNSSGEKKITVTLVYDLRFSTFLSLLDLLLLTWNINIIATDINIMTEH